ncbi:hypothetical protein [Clostridium chauvoei]|uniref:SHSP domain-containing protein n=2 Tax=Clostridium chauvoei TaxID=46867 RepID=S6EP23_9CLOT|nr:hypothetical protein [Clostridium chauvoei]ATD56119.1 hypothetical protein BTM20_13345 [Clostridium chauvoei]ATD58609.1 hypothetical protein BTM21_13370 [Clostridium chauvoei]MBX7281414.1 hypothetical protein [Clostridium chauvoei]MBX7283934.1 hypothetical protein [Clostridium chauvoei]MBX7286150.1 hypothetical protein [Clostridium chauvoei]
MDDKNIYNKFLNNKNKFISDLIDDNSLNTNPIINITQNKNYYDILISLNGLKKENLLLNYINNFLILNLNLKSKNNKSLQYKRLFYLKNIDICNITNKVSANLIYLKVPKLINY